MADSVQPLLTPKELIKAILKHQGVKAGKWGLSVQFGFGAGNASPDPSVPTSPTALVTVLAVGVAPANETTTGDVVDAATLYAPQPTKPAKKRQAKTA